MSSARASASSRYCVVSSTVVPVGDELADDAPELRRAAGSSPVVGSSRKITGGSAITLAARSSRRRMPPEYPLTSRSAASAMPKRSRSACGSPPGDRPRQPVETADHLEVRAAGEQTVDGRRLGGDADPRPHLRRRGDDVVSGDGRRALAGLGERRQEPHRRRLTGAVVPEQPEHGAGRHVEAEVPQRPQVAVALAKPARLNRGAGRP